MQLSYNIHKASVSKSTLVASPLPFLKKMSHPFRYSLSHKKRDRRFPRISGIVSVSFAVYWTLALTTTETRLCGLLVCTGVLILPSVRGLACALPCPICDEAVSMPRNRFSSCKFRSVQKKCQDCKPIGYDFSAIYSNTDILRIHDFVEDLNFIVCQIE